MKYASFCAAVYTISCITPTAIKPCRLITRILNPYQLGTRTQLFINILLGKEKIAKKKEKAKSVSR